MDAWNFPYFPALERDTVLQLLTRQLLVVAVYRVFFFSKSGPYIYVSKDFNAWIFQKRRDAPPTHLIGYKIKHRPTRRSTVGRQSADALADALVGSDS